MRSPRILVLALSLFAVALAGTAQAGAPTVVLGEEFGYYT